MEISELITNTLKKSGYTKALEDEKIEAENRIANLDEFLMLQLNLKKNQQTIH